jgi:hypothetical protein
MDGSKHFIRKAQNVFLRKPAAPIFCRILMTVKIVKQLDKS